jgi:hypothetical protein
MNFNQQDWHRLRYPIIVLGVVLILMTLLVGYVQKRKDTAQLALQTQQGQLNQARQRYQASGLEKETIVKYLPIYQNLISEGFIGEERRIEWVDSLRTIHQQNKLFSINYTIGTQEEYKPAFVLNVGSFALHRSIMKLELSMLHEGDLLTLIDALDAQKTTPFIVRQCEITRMAAITANTLKPNMLANCELDWLTLREPQAAGAAPL